MGPLDTPHHSKFSLTGLKPLPSPFLGRLRLLISLPIKPFAAVLKVSVDSMSQVSVVCHLKNPSQQFLAKQLLMELASHGKNNQKADRPTGKSNLAIKSPTLLIPVTLTFGQWPEGASLDLLAEDCWGFQEERYFCLVFLFPKKVNIPDLLDQFFLETSELNALSPKDPHFTS